LSRPLFAVFAKKLCGLCVKKQFKRKDRKAQTRKDRKEVIRIFQEFCFKPAAKSKS
jgi:hypothetical protein